MINLGDLMEKNIYRSLTKFAIASGLAIGIAATTFVGAQASNQPGPIFGNPQSAVTIQVSGVSLANAKRAAQSYLKVMGFSRKGLIDQLVFEGYSKSIAGRAVDSLKPNWNTQAGRVAKAYIKVMAFSRTALIDQLVFDGFTRAQAAAGARAVGY